MEELKIYLEKLKWDATCRREDVCSIADIEFYKGEIAAYSNALIKINEIIERCGETER